MYVQFRELTYEKSISDDVVETLRNHFHKSPLAVGINKKDSRKMAIVLLDLPIIKWYMAGSPITVLMQNSIMESGEIQGVIKKALTDVGPKLRGKWHISNQGWDSETLDSESAEYDWGSNEKKVQEFQKKVREGKFIDESGSPCDTCVDEQQFYGCPFCDYNPLSEINEDFDDLEQHWDEYPYSEA